MLLILASIQSLHFTRWALVRSLTCWQLLILFLGSHLKWRRCAGTVAPKLLRWQIWALQYAFAMFVHLRYVGIRVVWRIKFCWCHHFWSVVWLLVWILWVQIRPLFVLSVLNHLYTQTSLWFLRWWLSWVLIQENTGKIKRVGLILHTY